jgi:hypothetical protein
MQHFSALAALRTYDRAVGKRAGRTRAALLLGFADARLVALNLSREQWNEAEYTEREEYERILSALRDEFGAGELARLMGEGAAMSSDRAIA